MKWPTNTEYFEAIQSPSLCFLDRGLKGGSVKVDSRQLPVASSGNFAIVFQIDCGKRRYAVKCFTVEVGDRSKRYQCISSHIKKAGLDCFLDFDFIENAMLVSGKKFPVVKMEWVEGETLDKYIKKNLRTPQALSSLADRFLRVLEDLRVNGIAHGDLQHGNIIVVKNEIKLVDYDGIYVPGLKGMSGSEMGLANYQHPNRTASDFGPHLDNFSGWMIYVSLVALALDPTLWDAFSGGDDCLLFRRADFTNPSLSTPITFVLRRLESEGFDVRNFQLALASNSVDAVPPPAKLSFCQDRSQVVAHPSQWYVLSKQNSEEGVAAQVGEFVDEERRGVGASWVLDHLPPRSTVVFGRPDASVQALVIMFYCGVALFLFAILLAEAPQLWAASGLVVCLLTLIGVAASYRSTAEVKARHSVAFRCTESRRYLEVERGKFQELDKRLSKSTATIKTSIDTANSKKQSIESEKLKLLQKAEQLSKNQLDQNSRLIVDLASEIDGLRRNELTSYRQQHLVAALAKHRIESISLPGIGPNLKERLAYHGLHTAADFVDVVTSSGWGESPRTYFRMRNGNSVYVEGIGEAKGGTLNQWRKGVVDFYSNKLPTRLAQDAEDRINRQYELRQKSLQRDAIAIQQKYESESARIRNDSTQQFERVDIELKSILKRLELEAKAAKEQRITQNRLLDKCEFELARIDQELATFRSITFPLYLKKCLFWR